VFSSGMLNASADRRCPTSVSDALPGDALPRSAYTAAATASARTTPRTAQVSRVRITFEDTSGTRMKVQPAAALPKRSSFD
jgi:hypothetical protein